MDSSVYLGQKLKAGYPIEIKVSYLVLTVYVYFKFKVLTAVAFSHCNSRPEED